MRCHALLIRVAAHQFNLFSVRIEAVFPLVRPENFPLFKQELSRPCETQVRGLFHPIEVPASRALEGIEKTLRNPWIPLQQGLFKQYIMHDGKVAGFTVVLLLLLLGVLEERPHAGVTLNDGPNDGRYHHGVELTRE